MASSSSRTRAPPSAFPRSPTTATGPAIPKASKRGSSGQMTFEQALRSGGTVNMTEPSDLDALESPAPTSSRRPNSARMQPATPTVVPPTPTPTRTRERDATLREPPPTPSTSSSTDVFFDANVGPASPMSPTMPVTATDDADREYATKRRSLYRSPGTASSPDLATLVRKAKQRGQLLSSKHLHQNSRQEVPPPMPSTPGRGGRPSTSNNNRAGTPEHSWVMASPASLAGSDGSGAFKSMRARTTALWGKVTGGSVRDRSKSDATTAPSPRASPPPPMPPLPPSARPRTADVFTSKPLPPDPGTPPRAPSPDNTTVRPVRSGHLKRRSMSVSEIDGFLADQMHDFDMAVAPSAQLDLKVPVTPDKRVRPSLRQVVSDPAAPPVVTVENSAGKEVIGMSMSSEKAVVPPRSTSLNTPPSSRVRGPRERYPPSSAGRAASFAAAGALASPTHVRTPSGTTRDASRLWAPQRAAAFSSEPSLLPEDPGSPIPGAAPRLVASNQDLRRFPSSIRSSGTGKDKDKEEEDVADVESRGREAAQKCWDEDESFVGRDKIAEWLGGHKVVNKVALRFYMDNFDFSGLRLDMAFRRFCAKLYLKAETQQVDRILDEFSRRYWECNPGSLFGNASVVHAVSYSLLLLNTDLHIAELQSRMSKAQFVRNTLDTIRMQLDAPTPTSASASASASTPNTRNASTAPSTVSSASGGDTVRSGKQKRSDSITSWNSITREMVAGLGPTGQSTTTGGRHSAQSSLPSLPVSSASLPGSAGASVPSLPAGRNNDSSVSVGTESKTQSTLVSSMVFDRNWESDMESLLKDMYSAIKTQQVLQAMPTDVPSPFGGPLGRNRSLRVQPHDRLTTLKRGSIRGIQSILSGPGGSSPYADRDRAASPAPSYATSAHGDLLGSTLSFAQPALGFASNLSHTIIREAREDDERSEKSTGSSVDTSISIGDEELALLGPPWAKEGMLCRKQYNETGGKRARSKAWLDVFVVIQKGELSMFTFGGKGGAGGGGMGVGGGNWLENATPVGVLPLAHSLAHALPPPGYNRTRPHCMVLTLAGGSVYFFQAGTEELVNEWVATCNYWAARQSKEPLTGGVSNMEYGWNRALPSNTPGIPESDSEFDRDRDGAESVFSSGRGDTLSVRSGKSRVGGGGKSAGSPWAEKGFVNEWKPPQPPLVASVHDEEGQLEALKKHVRSMTVELEEHNELRAPMMSLYAPRSTNGTKALTNWENKSKWLLSEIVKYESYIDSLQRAMTLRMKRRGEKALERALREGGQGGGRSGKKHGEDGRGQGTQGRWRRPDEATIEESESEETTSAHEPVNVARSRIGRRISARTVDTIGTMETEED